VTLCACPCNQPVITPGSRFRAGHNRRVEPATETLPTRILVILARGPSDAPTVAKALGVERGDVTRRMSVHARAGLVTRKRVAAGTVYSITSLGLDRAAPYLAADAVHGARSRLGSVDKDTRSAVVLSKAARDFVDEEVYAELAEVAAEMECSEDRAEGALSRAVKLGWIGVGESRGRRVWHRVGVGVVS
jgi:DNA-binding MarR family transcriptional regulator